MFFVCFYDSSLLPWFWTYCIVMKLMHTEKHGWFLTQSLAGWWDGNSIQYYLSETVKTKLMQRKIKSGLGSWHDLSLKYLNKCYIKVFIAKNIQFLTFCFVLSSIQLNENMYKLHFTLWICNLQLLKLY